MILTSTTNIWIHQYKNNNENNYDYKSNDPLNQFFGNNNDDAKDNDKKEVS